MFETVKEVDESTITKEKNILLTREPTDSLLLGDVEYSDEMNHSLLIEGDVRKNKEPIGKLNYDSLFLLNEVKSTFRYKPIE